MTGAGSGIGAICTELVEDRGDKAIGLDLKCRKCAGRYYRFCRESAAHGYQACAVAARRPVRRSHGIRRTVGKSGSHGRLRQLLGIETRDCHMGMTCSPERCIRWRIDWH